MGRITPNVLGYELCGIKGVKSLIRTTVSRDFYLEVNLLHKNWKIKDDRMRAFAGEIWELLSQLPFSVSFTHVKREKNKEADKLVNQALDAYQS